MLLEMRLDPVEERVAARPVEERGHELHDARVRVQRRERLAILVPPTPKDQACRPQIRACAHRYTRLIITRQGFPGDQTP